MKWFILRLLLLVGLAELTSDLPTPNKIGVGAIVILLMAMTYIEGMLDK